MVKLIVGLGNPGSQYEQTRHNVGFAAANILHGILGGGRFKKRYAGHFLEGHVEQSPVALLQPQTYMNNSGRSVRAACDFYKLDVTDLLVICDDFNLPLGKLRLRASGSAGGQKGMADIIASLGTDQIPRLRIGIGSPPPGCAVTDFVLGRFRPTERDSIEHAIQRAAFAAADWAVHGIQWCMAQYNGDSARR